MNGRLQQIIDELPLIRQLFEHDVYLSIMDTDGKLQGFSLPDGVPAQLHIGDSVQDPTGASQEVLRTGKTIHNKLPKEVMGEAFEGVLVPIKDDSTIVGCIMCTYSVDSKEQILDIAAKFRKSIHDINDSIRTVVDGINNLFQTLTDMNNVTQTVEHDVNAAVDVVGKISANASRSNILALNASIEAARSGEHGRGFSVVATEMGKLANDSGHSATEIKTTLTEITNHLASIVDSIKDANDMASQHIEDIGKIQKVLEDTVVLAEKLEDNVNN